MSKSKGNTIEIGMDADTTARLIKKAVTDAERFITYEPERRPEVANLLLLAGLATDREPAEIAEEIGNGGGGGLKNFVTEAINAYFAPIRARRAELVADPGHLLDVLRAGNARANEIADATLDEVRTAMGMKY
jgi:tryptophanyl-tRNA synthetase